MPINKVDLTVSQLINDLNEGLTWLKKDDLGYGSIEEKYNANEKQILTIRKHPKLKNVETNITIFNIIDDTNIEITTRTSKRDTLDETQISTETKKPEYKESICDVQQETMEVASGLPSMDTSTEAVDIFAQL